MSELEELQERLELAERVCILFGWTSLRDGSERSDAVTQAWMDWHHKYGHEKDNLAVGDPKWDELIKDLARRRREIREATIARWIAE